MNDSTIPVPAAVHSLTAETRRASSDAAGAVDLTYELSLIYEELSPGLIRYASSISHNVDLAAEAVQETFLRYFLHRQQGETIANARAWLFKVLRNLMIDAVRKRSGSTHVPIEDASELQCSDSNALEALEFADLTARLTKLLSPRELECVQLRAEGLKYEEIASALEVSVASVRTALARAMEKLRRNLE
jgi:RNA polymerase sigma-70 factor (ECF subfamily)